MSFYFWALNSSREKLSIVEKNEILVITELLSGNDVEKGRVKIKVHAGGLSGTTNRVLHRDPVVTPSNK